MKKYIFEGKNLEEVTEKALKELNVKEEDTIIKILEEKNGLLKKSIKIEITTVQDIINFIKDTINKITSLMNINVNLEVRKREKNIEIKIFSDNNSILIGHEGRTLESLQNIIRQIVEKEVGNEYRIILDIENYRDKKVTNLERTAKRIAREVKTSGVEVKLEPMNSYERRIIHNILSKNKYVYTESTGEEPNRCVVIKLKENKEEKVEE